jgi:Ca2+-dependent lipid-binding protein
MASFHLEDTETYKLIVNVIKATDLLGADIGGKSDPYVAVGWAYSREKHKPKTKVIKKNLNPEWDETFELTHNTRCGSKLEFCVYDKKLIGKDEFCTPSRCFLTILCSTTTDSFSCRKWDMRLSICTLFWKTAANKWN